MGLVRGLALRKPVAVAGLPGGMSMWNTGTWAGVALLLAAGAAGASCPAGPDALSTGIVVRYDDGSVSTFRSGDENGVVVEEAIYNDPDHDVDADIYRTLFGIYELEAIGMQGGAPVPDTVVRRSFAASTADLPRPTPGLVWTGSAQVTYGADPALTAEITVTVGAEQRVGFGGCTYDSLTVLVREVDPETESVLVFDWLPDLGIGIYRSYAEPGGEPELYTPLSIEAAGGN
jgi:hypothetical protein